MPTLGVMWVVPVAIAAGLACRDHQVGRPSEVPAVSFGAPDTTPEFDPNLLKESLGDWRHFFGTQRRFGLAERLFVLCRQRPGVTAGDVFLRWGTATVDPAWRSFCAANTAEAVGLEALIRELSQHDHVIPSAKRWCELARGGEFGAGDSLLIERGPAEVGPMPGAGLREKGFFAEGVGLLFPDETGQGRPLPIAFEDVVILWDSVERDPNALGASEYYKNRLQYMATAAARVPRAGYRRADDGSVDLTEFRYDLAGRVRRYDNPEGPDSTLRMRAMERIWDGCRTLDYFVQQGAYLVGRDTLIPVLDHEGRLAAVLCVSQVAADNNGVALTIQENLVGMCVTTEARCKEILSSPNPAAALRSRWLATPNPWVGKGTTGKSPK